jgi:hypothetical protein
MWGRTVLQDPSTDIERPWAEVRGCPVSVGIAPTPSSVGIRRPAAPGRGAQAAGSGSESSVSVENTSRATAIASCWAWLRVMGSSCSSR